MPQDTQVFPTVQALSQQLEKGAIANEAHVYVESREAIKGANHGIQISSTLLAALRASNTLIMQMPLVRLQPRDLKTSPFMCAGETWMIGSLGG
eukprot:49826-Pyramimonas_sp.AAC.1